MNDSLSRSGVGLTLSRAMVVHQIEEGCAGFSLANPPRVGEERAAIISLMTKIGSLWDGDGGIAAIVR
jgi:hypothetical protein